MDTYSIVNIMGEGSFGQVVHATDKQTGQEVAIKLIQGIFNDKYQAKKILGEI